MWYSFEIRFAGSIRKKSPDGCLAELPNKLQRESGDWRESMRYKVERAPLLCLFGQQLKSLKECWGLSFLHFTPLQKMIYLLKQCSKSAETFFEIYFGSFWGFWRDNSVLARTLCWDIWLIKGSAIQSLTLNKFGLVLSKIQKTGALCVLRARFAETFH